MPSLETSVYLGSYTQPHCYFPNAAGMGIVSCAFNSRTGSLEQRNVFGGVLNPSYLALDETETHLFAVAENLDAPGAVYVFRRECDGRLTPVGMQPSGGRATCHVCVTTTGLVAASSYLDGNLIVYRFAHGVLGPSEKLFRYEGSGVNAARQEASHAHHAALSPDSRWLYVCDLGADRIWCHALGSGCGDIAAASPDSVATPAGSGPRHLVFHPTLPRAYVICELNAHVLTFDWEARSGRLTLAEDRPSLPLDWNGQPSAAAIRVHPSARALCVSNRGHDSLTFFRVDGDGRTAFTTCIAAGGRKPRDFSFDPTGRWLLAANQDSNSVAIHEIDPDSGLPVGRTPEIMVVGTPVCVLFAQPRGEIS